MTPSPAPARDLVTEDAVARAFAVAQAGRLRFCHDSGAWFAFDGAAWRRDRTGLALQRARELARDDAVGARDAVRTLCGRTSFVAGVERFARGEAALAVTADDWDADPFRLGTPGGTVDLATGTMGPSDPADGITRTTAVTPTADADCPLWRRFFDETAGGDAGLVRFLQQFLGYCLTGSVKEHALVFGYGSGGNGKSVLLNTVAGVLGDYAAVAALETFAATSCEKHSTDLAMLRGARLVTVSETEEGRAWAETRIKLLTGGDPVTARFMRRDFFTFTPTFKLIIVGNHKPVLRTVDDAARRRFCIVPFVHRPERPDCDLEGKLRDEWPAILRWMIAGCLDWQANGLTRPDTVRAATAAYFGAQDIVGQFLDEACLRSERSSVPAGALFAAWTSWAKSAGEAPGTQRAFADALERRGVVRERSRSTRCYVGLTLKAPAVTQGDADMGDNSDAADLSESAVEASRCVTGHGSPGDRPIRDRRCTPDLPGIS